jgi:hypothetical protein
VESGLIQSLHNGASAIWQKKQDLFNEISNSRRALQLNGYPQGFIDSVIAHYTKGQNTKEKPLDSTPYVKDVSEKFKCIGNR